MYAVDGPAPMGRTPRRKPRLGVPGSLDWHTLWPGRIAGLEFDYSVKTVKAIPLDQHNSTLVDS